MAECGFITIRKEILLLYWNTIRPWYIFFIWQCHQKFSEFPFCLNDVYTAIFSNMHSLTSSLISRWSWFLWENNFNMPWNWTLVQTTLHVKTVSKLSFSKWIIFIVFMKVWQRIFFMIWCGYGYKLVFNHLVLLILLPVS